MISSNLSCTGDDDAVLRCLPCSRVGCCGWRILTCAPLSDDEGRALFSSLPPSSFSCFSSTTSPPSPTPCNNNNARRCRLQTKLVPSTLHNSTSISGCTHPPNPELVNVKIILLVNTRFILFHCPLVGWGRVPKLSISSMP